MGWLQERKARKALEKLGMDKTYLKQMGKELKQGHKDLIKQRDELRKLESPTYDKLIKQIGKIFDIEAPVDKKKRISIKLVQDATLSEYERNALLELIESIYKVSMKMVNADTFKLSDTNSILLVGQTGSGKSYFVHKIIEKLENTYSSEELKYALFDLKYVEFRREGEDYKKAYLLFDVVADPNVALDQLDILSAVADDRVRLNDTKPKLFIYIEECDATVIDQQRFDKALININSKAKKANMILIYSTSRQDKSTISDNLLKSFDKVLAGALASKETADRFRVPFEDIPKYSFREVKQDQ